MTLTWTRSLGCPVAALLTISALAAQDWSQLIPLTLPPVRTAPAMAYDLARQEVVMFGGALTGAATGGLQDTWTWNGTDWTAETPATVPPTRAWASMSYDLARSRIVMFGGRIHGGPVGATGALNDTWEWDGTDWTLIATNTSPPPRYSGTMAYDSARAVHVLFSGVTAGNISYNDTWEYNGATATWTQVVTSTLPAGRVYGQMAYDTRRGRCVVFGGADDAFVTLPDVFWEYDGIDWVAVTTNVGPGSCEGILMVYDFARARIVIQGGRNGDRTFRIGTWEYDGTNTYYFNAETTPASGNWFAAMAYDIGTGRTVRYGGYNTSFQRVSDTWERSPDHPGFDLFGAGCPSGAGSPMLNSISLPVLGGNYSLGVGNLPAASTVVLLLGFSNTNWLGIPLPLDLGLLGLSGCTLYTSIDLEIPLTPVGTTASWTIPIPNMAGLQGAVFYDQAVVLSGAGLQLSNASESRIF